MKKRFQRIKQTAANLHESGKKRVERAREAWTSTAGTSIINRIASAVKAAIADS